jgi:hypothetical protein
MTVNILEDLSWNRALELAKVNLDPQPALVRLIRSAWTCTTENHDLNRMIQAASVPPLALIQAAKNFTPGLDTIEHATNTLGIKGTATVAAICFTCDSINRRCTSERSKSAITQHIIDTIEIGYHFGLSAESIGPETGILLGFAQSLGPALVLASTDSGLNETRAIIDDCRAPEEYISQFGCEPYQVASMALQRLGFGPAVSSAAVMALGNLNHQPISSDPSFLSWWAASEWIAALARGSLAPKRKSSADQFPDLLNKLPPDQEPPLHLKALYGSIESVRAKHSTWAWHLVEPSGQPQKPPDPAAQQTTTPA